MDWHESLGVMRDVMDAAQIAIIITDAEGAVLSSNKATTALLGISGDADIDQEIGTAHGGSTEGYHEMIASMLSGESLQGTEMLRRLPDGEERHLQIAGGPLRDPDGSIVGALIVISDMTQRRSSERELAEHRDSLEELVELRTAELMAANERLEEAAKAKSAFVAGMGHEMRNHLNSIIGFSGVILQGLTGELGEEQRRQIDMIYDAGQRLLAVVNDVVDLSKIEAGQMEAQVVPFELLGFLEDMVSSFQAIAKERGVDIVLRAPRGVLPMHTDRSKIDQVVRNVISNAIKFTPGGTVTLEVERSNDEESAIIRVRDTGEGIAPEIMSRVFDEFVTFDRTGSSAKKGTGLGLAISRRLCEMLGGSISARSIPGEGSVFTLVIPVSLPEPEPLGQGG